MKQMTITQTKQKSRPSPREIIADIRDSDDFREAMQDGKPLAHAFSVAAEALAELETTESGRRTPEGHAYALVGQIFDVASSAQVLRSKHLTPEAKIPHKRRLIRFNHELRAMVDAYQDLSPQEVHRMLIEPYIAIARSGWSSDEQARQEVGAITEEVDTIMFGMWGEINGEMIVGAAGYEIDTDVTEDDELKGIDGWVHMQPDLGDNYGWMPIDFKGSAEKARQVNNLHPNNRAVWSQLSHAEFKRARTFRIPPQLAQAKSGAMRRQLEELYKWHTR